MLSQKFIEAFSGAEYQDQSSKMTQLLAKYLDENLNEEDTNTMDYKNPEEELVFWKNYNSKDVVTLFDTIIQRSIKIHNPKFIGHQVSAPLPLTAVMSELSAMLNNGMAVYEMGAAATAIEKVVIDQLKGYFGYDENGDGIFTSGGTLANVTAMLCARSNQIETSWLGGTNYNQYAVMVSEEAHYCIDRAIKIMGWGEAGFIKIPVNNSYCMKTELLEQYYEEATNKGVKIIAIVGSAPTTSTGKYDDLETIGQFAKKYNLWYHVDAAHGGPAIFTKKYQHLLRGINYADSITVDCHKMMLVPALTTMLLFKNKKTSYQTFAQHAQYLFDGHQEEWHNMGKRTMECTKLMMATRIYAVLQIYGLDIISEFVTHVYDVANWFSVEILKSADFELAVIPDSNIVCFRYVNGDKSHLSALNQEIRLRLIQDGLYYIVQTNLKGQIYLRISIMNPFTGEKELENLLKKIRLHGQNILNIIA